MSLTEKGNFGNIDKDYLRDLLISLNDLSKLQKKYGKGDNDSILNEGRDSIVGLALNFNQINYEKHGFDVCRDINGIREFLEVKCSNYDGCKSMKATFNDTTREKAILFEQDNVYLGLAGWGSATELKFIAFGKNPQIGSYLKKRVDDYLTKHTAVRCTQSIGISELVNKYNFNIYSVSLMPDELYGKFQTRTDCKKISREKIFYIKEINENFINTPIFELVSKNIF